MSIMYENRLFSACFIVWMYRYTTFEIKVNLCAHTDSKNGIFTRRVYSAYILTRTPSPFSAGSSWGLLSRKIFYFFRFSYSISTRILFFYFFRFSFWLSNINYRFDSHTSFAWYLLVWFSLYFPRINFDLFRHCRFYALTLQLFISSTLLLIINKHLCLCKVWFMLVLAILRLSDVFSFVLGVVYRLWIK